ncbi:peptidylprolyl isomerase [Bacillus sp. FJAT-27225]|uniref:peptidylprolyl isomerase n=1 Tax=Bacillus sp. FJAT-27225 TaxID=1743144 RepID=UPI00080C2F18|nr:peptidylprolyl isomerase [Bacillus sp. FJAT-27225]OCA84352.1 peptidylprolyl isomerase [Bacillus sp. FJAT-27225]
MKKWMLALALTGGVLTLGACNNTDNGSGEVVAESKAGDITKDDLYNLMKDKYGSPALQQLVYEKVLSDKYKVTDEEVDKKVDELKNDLGPNFEMALAQYGFNSEDDLKETFRIGLLQEKAALKDVEATEEEMKEYYENYKPEIKARHILIGTENQTPEAAEKTAKEVKARLDKGEKFEDVAKEVSTDTLSAQEGGDLGWFQPGTGKMVPEFDAAAAKLKKGEISAPVQTEYGYHIIQVTDIKEKKSYEDMKDEIEYQVKVAKLTPEMINEAMQRELKDAKVKINDKELKNALESNPQQ